MPCQTPIIVALDFPSRDAALALAGQLDPALCRVKVGKELFTRCGPPVVEALHCLLSNFLFLSLKTATGTCPMWDMPPGMVGPER